MDQPPGFEAPNTSNLVCKLHKAIYWLKQAPRAWFDKLHSALLNLGFISGKSDQSLFVKTTSQHKFDLLVYVDDILVTGSDPHTVSSLIANLNHMFALKDLGEMSYFLGIQASKLPNGNIHLSQRKYILDLLIRANMQNAKPIATPMIGGQTLSAHGSDPVMDTQLYRSIVGALQYATITRPQITYSVNKVCQFM